MMARNVQRRSQLVSIFGPGSMIDLPTRSVIVGGLENWALDFKEPEIVEPRLSMRLSQALKKKGWLAEDKFLKLRPPPEAADAQARFHPLVIIGAVTLLCLLLTGFIALRRKSYQATATAVKC